MKLPDAKHVANAMATGCEVFLSNDRPLRIPAASRSPAASKLGRLWQVGIDKRKDIP